MRKYSLEDYIRMLKEYDIKAKFLDDKNNFSYSNKKQSHLCTACGELFSREPSDIIRSFIRFSNIIPHTKCPNKNKRILKEHTIEEYKSRVDNLENKYKIENYKGISKSCKHTCLICGYTFNTMPSNVIARYEKGGHYCYNCNLIAMRENKKNSLEDFINKFKSFNYSLLEEYNGVDKLTKLKCNKCDYEFSARLQNVYTAYTKGKHYCPNCNKMARTSIEEKYNKISENFIIDKSIIENSRRKETIDNIICKRCNSKVSMSIDSMLSSKGCVNCSQRAAISHYELELNEFINNLGFNTICNSREILGNGQEIDIYIPKKRLAIEINGLYWHSDIHKPNDYHLKKKELAKENNIDLIHIYEDSLIDPYKKEIVYNKIRYKLNNVENKVYARNTKIVYISEDEKNRFLEDNHLQGTCFSSINLGLMYNDIILAVMTFSKTRKIFGTKEIKDAVYELTRYAIKNNYSIVGGFGKLFKYFIKTYEFDKIISYCDYDLYNGITYTKNGFRYSHTSRPSYSYFHKYDKNLYYRMYRFNFAKHKLEHNIHTKNYYDKELTEKEITRRAGFLRIYNSGNKVFIYENK